MSNLSIPYAKSGYHSTWIFTRAIGEDQEECLRDILQDLDHASVGFFDICEVNVVYDQSVANDPSENENPEAINMEIESFSDVLSKDKLSRDESISILKISSNIAKTKISVSDQDYWVDRNSAVFKPYKQGEFLEFEPEYDPITIDIRNLQPRKDAFEIWVKSTTSIWWNEGIGGEINARRISKFLTNIAHSEIENVRTLSDLMRKKDLHNIMRGEKLESPP